MKLLFNDIKIINSPRAKARLYFSNNFNQIIYIKKIDSLRSISRYDFSREKIGIKEKMMSDALRRMQQLCGQKKGYKKYSDAYKLLIFIAPNISKDIYQYLWAFNTLLKNKHQKIMFNVFDSSIMFEGFIAGAIFGILFKQYHGWYTIFKKSLDDKNVKPFGKPEIKMYDLENICNKLKHNFYKFSSKEMKKKRYDEEWKHLELNIIPHILGNLQISINTDGDMK
jgi:hypothetical protein